MSFIRVILAMIRLIVIDIMKNVVSAFKTVLFVPAKRVIGSLKAQVTGIRYVFDKKPCSALCGTA